MPKYFDFMVCGYYLYFTSHCIIEAMHVHANTEVKSQGILTDKELRIIRDFIKDNYKEMYVMWSSMSRNGFYKG